VASLGPETSPAAKEKSHTQSAVMHTSQPTMIMRTHVTSTSTINRHKNLSVLMTDDQLVIHKRNIQQNIKTNRNKKITFMLS